MPDWPESASRVAGQPLEGLAGHRPVEVDARALDAYDNLGGAGWSQEPPHAVAGKVLVQQMLIVADRNDLLDAHAAEHVADLVAHADRIEQVARLHGGPPEAGP